MLFGILRAVQELMGRFLQRGGGEGLEIGVIDILSTFIQNVSSSFLLHILQQLMDKLNSDTTSAKVAVLESKIKVH